MRSLSSLPAPKACRWVIESAGPSDQVFHASCCQQRTLRLQPLYSEILRIRDDSFGAQLCRFRCLRFQADRAHSSHRCEGAAALLLPFGFVEICNAFLGDDMTHVISVDHDGGNWHPCLLANLHRVESFHERGNAPALKGLNGLNHEFATANYRLLFRNQIKPRGGTVPSSMRIVSHVGRASESCQPSDGDRR